ncbi:murein L,D-transpeptidase family protein [Vannielia litorea]|uniref:L,D-transpeptidase family protein n=1 Tax=Vannielia litorea TaxID=1217970 RepID=UPI001C98774F|nr:L,D-transpeptidase family protein [Vannielia litorea]MBY6049153.1 L,D-transpeptidase family protein [Vannielia litorea]MBY6076567.1 L,D-transpeptidase family protein [Vannielia litorea]
MKRIFRIVAALAVLAVGLVGYTAAMARVGSGTAPEMAAESEQADEIRVDKSERRLELLRAGAVIRSYEVSLGAAPEGHKAREGDERTPTGRYVIDWRNPNSIAHLSLHISYPNAEDRARAEAAGHSPGGDIMIHGIANGWGWLGGLHRAWDWTNGCIAVTDAEMREIWALVPDGTPITISE